MTSRHALAALTIAIWIAVARAAPQEPARTSESAEAIEGHVIAADDTHRPIRGATVEVLGNGPVQRVLTGDSGEFRVSALRPGQYRVAAAKAAYLRSEYGATELGGAGTPVIVTANTKASVTIPLTRGAVLTGVIREHGQPTPDVVVTAHGPSGGTRSAEAQPVSLQVAVEHQAWAWTNHDGEYRIYGLSPGEYTIDAQPSLTLRRITHGALPLKAATVDAVLAQLRTAALRGGDFRTVPTVVPDGRVSEPVGVSGYAPVYFPGTVDRRLAVSIPLAAGEERGGLDFELMLRGTARIRGRIAGPSGEAPKVASVTAISAGSPYTATANGGTFEIPNVPPGHYTLEARTIEGLSESGLPGASPVSFTWWALAEIDVEDAVVDGVTLTLEPPMTFSGRVIFDGARPPDSAGTRVSLRRVDHLNPSLTTASALTNARGEFRVTDIGPGTFSLDVGGGAVSNGGWWLRSAMLNGRDLLDAPLEFGRSTKNLGDVAVTLTNRHTGISGTLRGATGDSATGTYVLVFSTQPTDWHDASRRVVSTRPAVDGSFAFKDVPPGDYYIAVVTTQPREWRSSAFLSQIVNAALPVSLHEGERITQELRLGR